MLCSWFTLVIVIQHQPLRGERKNF